jgi:hypothetical protein
VDRGPDAAIDPLAIKWTGGTAILVVAGDLIDKGPHSLGVIDLLRSLEKQAIAAGGQVIVTLGNHEAEFLADPENDKASSTGQDANGINSELESAGIQPKTLAAGKDSEGRGTWLRNLPLGLRVKKWFFCHSGNTAGDSIHELDKRLRSALQKRGFADKEIAGSKSILQAEHWYGDEDHDNTAKNNAEALGVKHIVFGHDPGALKDRGTISASKDKVLFKLDVALGLSAGASRVAGQLLHIRTKGQDSAEILNAHGEQVKILL